ncbi:MAG: septum formation initiator family protein [Sporolactobacillus sp.]
MQKSDMQVTKLVNGYLPSEQVAEKRRRKRRRALFRRLTVFLALFAAACVWMVSSLVSQAHDMTRYDAQKQQLNRQLQDSMRQTSQLRHRVKLLHNKEYIGEIARQDCLLSKDGEIIFSKSSSSKH